MPFNRGISRDSNQAIVELLGGMDYETVAAGVGTPQALGGTGAAGDLLSHLIVNVATAATSNVSIKDGSDTAIEVVPANIGSGVGPYTVYLGLKSRTGAWQITTGAGVSVIAAGLFKA